MVVCSCYHQRAAVWQADCLHWFILVLINVLLENYVRNVIL